MAKPQTPEEQKIYEEMLEKYKEEGTFGLSMIIGLAKDETDKMPWKDVPEEINISLLKELSVAYLLANKLRHFSLQHATFHAEL